jgi:hypothetical protein
VAFSLRHAKLRGKPSTPGGRVPARGSDPRRRACFNAVLPRASSSNTTSAKTHAARNYPQSGQMDADGFIPVPQGRDWVWVDERRCGASKPARYERANLRPRGIGLLDEWII